jgi:DNA-binding HxlR family transcriptional regulator
MLWWWAFKFEKWTVFGEGSMAMKTTYGQFCSVAKASEVIAERWTPLIVRELVLGSHRFNDLERGLPHISRSLLASRLRQLERAGVIARRVETDSQRVGYYLTPAGQELEPIIMQLGVWGQRWANRDIGPDDLDPRLLVWDMRRRIHRDRLPARRICVQIDFTGARKDSIWLLLEPSDVAMCLTNPGFDLDLLVTADTVAFHRVWIGRLSFGAAMRDGLINLQGTSDIVRAFPRWLALSSFASIPSAQG